MHYILAHEHLLCHTDNLIFPVLVEDDDVVDVRAVTYKLVFLQASTDKSVCAVDIQFLICLRHLCCLDSVEVAYLCKTRMILTVFILKELEPTGCHLHEICQVTVYILYLRLYSCHQFISFVLIELKDTLHLYLQQFQNIILCYLTYQTGIVRCQSFVNMFAYCIDGRSLFEFLILIDTFLYEDLLERVEMQLLQKFVLANLKFLADKILCSLHVMDKHIRYGKKLWFLICDNATVR